MSQQQKMNRFSKALYRFWDTRINFLHLHYLYILLLTFLFSGLYYCESGTDWSYIDALFMATTGATDTGLNTIAMSKMSTYHMVLLYLSAFFGSHVIISFYVVMVRRYYFSQRFEEELKENKRRRDEYKRQKLARLEMSPIRRRMSLLSIRSSPATSSKHTSMFSRRRASFDTHATRTDDIVVHHTMHAEKEHCAVTIDDEGVTSMKPELTDSHHPCDITPDDTIEENTSNTNTDTTTTTNTDTNQQQQQQQQQQQNTITFREDTNVLRERERKKLLQNRNHDEGDYYHQLQQQQQQHQLQQISLQRSNSEYEIMRQPVKKSELTKHEKYRIGGTEYRALDMLARIVPMYYIGFIIFFGFFFRIYIAASTYAQEVLKTSNPNEPVNPWFFSMFMSLSSFTNLGLNHLDSSMMAFQNAPAPLILAIILILVGNTAFAILLRFIIWFCFIVTPKSNIMRRETFRYLLDHPRRCYTTLFPATQTWWLLIVLIAITLIELICFLALNYWLPVLADISWGSRFLDGLFQSVATRNAGFSVVSLADLNPGAQLVYIIAMYISVYPVAISMRNSNIYQERALGIFRGEDEEPVQFSENDLSTPPFIKLKRHSTMTSIAQGTKKLLKGPDFFVITQIQRQLTSDICWVITGIFCICVLEAESIMSPSPVTIATVIYECVSAFGNVGASTGYPNTATSQAAQYRTLSKLVLIILMYKGRHRGLPAAIDRSILLPSDELAKKEKEDEERRRNTSVSFFHINDTVGSSTGTNGPDHVMYARSCTL